MKNIISNWSRLCGIGVSLMVILCLTANYSTAQCDMVPGTDAMFTNSGYNMTDAVQICYLVDDATGNVIASDTTGNCDFTNVPFGAYSVYALNDCTTDNTTDITTDADDPSTLTELLATAGASDVDMAGPSSFTVCDPSMLVGCEGENITVSSMPDFNMTNDMMYVLVCGDTVVATSMGPSTATFTLPNDGDDDTTPTCTVQVLNYCASGIVSAIVAGAVWNTVDPTAAGDFDGASAPVDFSGCPLPLDLVSYNGECLGEEGVQLNWQTGSEVNVSKFIIERSLTGNEDEFVQIGEVAAKGSAGGVFNYTFVDQRAPAKAYYRLLILDNDNSYETSGLELVECVSGEFGITSIHPNPTKDKIIITFETEDRSEVNFKLIDVLGRTLMQETITPELGINTKEVDFNFLSSAVYFVVFENNKKRIAEKVIKRHK